MRQSAFALLFLSFVSGSLALVARGQSAGCTCGSAKYSASDVTNAINQAEGSGGGKYPHQYHDYEKFSFPSCQGNFYEYPLEEGKVYTGGSPGADRVIYDEKHNFCACLTHHGSSQRDGFVECK
ncbi:hypothetical protein HYDPIDRAFT_131178 [Hydnomerulius pinastri MD-312]|uniref:Uncharacterized protein n=1 Tax=Hydnomerulius pinastri MD-312 TaxID=994086 RepID=A0A0C9WAJ5_9AGAM|nr:hypothetical protein HYDPIDRAFT_131178 [Hydnomerulius pinastri MD-312]